MGLKEKSKGNAEAGKHCMLLNSEEIKDTSKSKLKSNENMPVQFKGKIDATSDDRLTKTKILHHKTLENNNKTEKIPITKDENISKELLEFNADDTTSKEE